MPKNKSWGENTKAVEAKARKAKVVNEEKDKREKAKEDAFWEDDDKSLAKKQNRKEEKEKKKTEKLERKTINKLLTEEETEKVLSATNSKAPAKITRAEIEAEREKREAAARKASSSKKAEIKPPPLVENLNRLQTDDEAKTVEEAIKMLSVVENNEEIDKHPERRLKAAFSAYEDKRLPELRSENSSLKLSQIKQMLFEEWKISPENPLNKQTAAYNSK